jgi:diguanylate cyclase (GGDEF)-like protein
MDTSSKPAMNAEVDPQTLQVGIRPAQIATSFILVTLLAALGMSAFRNADARDRETEFLSTVEETATLVISAQRDSLAFIDAIDDWRDNSRNIDSVWPAYENLTGHLDQIDASDEIAKSVISPTYLSAVTELESAVKAQNTTSDAINNARATILRESRGWLTTYQTTAVAELKELSENRATNERNQAVLLLASLALSVWLLSWIAISVARTYRKARVIISQEESKVVSARSALRHASDQLSYQAHHDSLTGLPNRVALMENLSIALNEKAQQPVTVFFCDLDRFKVVNDSLGHAIGDELLIEAAVRLASAVREQDFVARFGGDEFVVVCTDIEDNAAALRMAERITRALSKPFDMHGDEAFIGVSIGIATSRIDSTANQMLRDADIAMYRAKALPGAHIEVFDITADSYSVRFDTENALRRAINNNQLLLHWQPIVNLKNGQAHTLEALVRWDRPGAGILLPAEFMGIAEDSGLIVELGRWVISAACSAAALTDDRSVAVNVSARQLRDIRFVDDLREILAESGLPPERLILEVTEHTVIDSAVVNAPLRRVRELGVRVALDDFGTGYSSLGLLNRLPVDIVKLDRAFVREITTNEPNQAIVKALVQLTAALNMMLIVEGVESDAQRKTLRSLGVLHGQGYWFGQPEPGRILTK